MSDTDNFQSEILLSICVAIYNIKEEFLRACIESITADMSAGAELILGDDCSNEKTAEVCREYAEKDCRIQYVRPPKNGGVSYIRNVMINRAKGKMITFIDGDDIAANGYSAALCSAFDSSGREYDIVMFKRQRFESIVPNIKIEDGKITAIPQSAAQRFSQACLTGAPPNAKDYGICDSTPSSVCIKAYRREFLIENNLKFKVGLKKSQDVEFNTRAFFVCKSLGYMARVLYLYRNNPESVTNRYNPNIKGILYDCIGCDRENLKTLYQNAAEIEQEWQKYKLIHYIMNFFELDVFHKDNPKSPKERKDDFIGFVNAEPFKTFFKTFDFSAYHWNERRLILRLAAVERFGLSDFMYKNPILFKVYGKLKKLFGGKRQN